MKTYSDYLCDWLVELGYTHCFFLAGGNVMHLLNSARTRFKCVPVVHEVTAGISAEYFNELNSVGNNKAFALVTAGPGLTNIVTAIAAAQIESRSLLVIGGQVKSADLNDGTVRQRGIQEIDGVSIVKSVCKAAVRLDKPITKAQFLNLESETSSMRKGVVFLEICLDVQGQPFEETNQVESLDIKLDLPAVSSEQVNQVAQLIKHSQRPVFLIGGGLQRDSFAEIYPSLCTLGIPLMCTWNGADRVPNDSVLFWGRPNTWGMRSSNILLQQADVVVALGTRLGLQQTGFNWQEFAPLAKVIQVEIDQTELAKGHPKLTMAVNADANQFIEALTEVLINCTLDFTSWINFGKKVFAAFPTSESTNNSFEGFWNPYDFMRLVSRLLKPGEVLIPSSSGAAETVAMQSAEVPGGAFVITDKGMASMGYGLAGAVGAAFKTGKRILHIEGDGGFAQNLQELGTVSINKLPIKMFIFDNGGYASIKMTQRSYFQGHIVGCDRESGLGLPDWVRLFNAYGISCREISPTSEFDEETLTELNDSLPRAFLVPIHPDQTYFPKIISRVMPNGEMVSNPLHLMSPDLTDEQIRTYLPYLADRILKPNQTTNSQ